MKEPITINKLKRLGFYFPDEEYFHKYRYVERDYVKDIDPVVFLMYYNLFDKESPNDREIITFQFESPVMDDNTHLSSINNTHIEMNAFGGDEHCWTIAEVYSPDNMSIIKAVINLWNSSSKKHKVKCI